MLRVRQLRFACVHPEERGIESIDIIENRARGNVRWILAECGVVFEQVRVEGDDALDTGAEVSPECRDVGRTRKTARHPNDGDAVTMRKRRRRLHRALRVSERPGEPFIFLMIRRSGILA